MAPPASVLPPTASSEAHCESCTSRAHFSASALDAKPTPGGALIGMADGLWLVPIDLLGNTLVAPFEPGCVDG